MTTLHREVERKFELDDDAPLPDLADALMGTPLAALGVTGLDEAVTHRLEATYYDTAGLALAAARTTLRRRTGGEDAGWHLKLPALDGARQEVRLPLHHADGPDGPDGPDATDPAEGTDAVPEELRRLVSVTARGQELVPVARLVTERTARHLLDAQGRALAEVADDRVTATRLTPGGSGGNGAGGPQASSWRELEVELVGGGEQLLDAVAQALAGLGVRPAAAASKLARALGTAPAAPAGADLGPGSSAGQVVLAHVGEQVRELVSLDPHVRLDAPDSIHRMRVASRRLRSALKTFRPLFERERVRAVRDELRWWAGVLGGARDAEVLRDRLAGAARADAEWSPERAAAAAAALEGALGREYRSAHDAVVAELDGERYGALVTALEALVEHPPLTEQAARPAGEVLLRLARRAHRELRDLVEQALDPQVPPGEERDAGVHEARKSAKRARYAAEALSPVWPQAGEYAKGAKRVQAELGDHQDSVVARTALLRLADHTELAPHAFALGRLHAREQAAADAAEDALPQLWAAASAPALRGWMER
jgi:CHAD domain-containing protein